jgi:hypothetical protein
MVIIVKYSQVNEELLNNLVFKKDERGNIKISYIDKTGREDKLAIQGTTIRVPFGVSRNDNGRLGQTLLSMQARPVKNEDKMKEFNNNVDCFRNAIILLNDKFRKEFFKNYEDWMNDSDLDDDELDDMYRSFYVPNENYADNIKVEFKDYTFTDKKTHEEKTIQTNIYNWKTHDKMSADILLGNNSMKGDYIKPHLSIDTMIIKRGDGGKGETIRPKLTISSCKYFPKGNDLNKIGETRFNHVDDDEDY